MHNGGGDHNMSAVQRGRKENMKIQQIREMRLYSFAYAMYGLALKATYQYQLTVLPLSFRHLRQPRAINLKVVPSINICSPEV